MSGDLVVTKILPDMTGATGSISVRDIGDSTHRFANVWADEVHVGASSLYVNGKQVISDNSNIMTFATDPDQGVNLKTVSSVAGTGNGNLQLTSDNQIGVTAKGGIDMTVPSNVASKNLTLTNSSTNGSIILNAASQIQFTAPTVSTGNLTVTGDLVVNGTTTSINTTNLLIEDNIVVLNKNQTGTPSTTLVSGLDVERGDQANYRFAFEELTDTFKIGMVGQLQPVATREDTPVSGGVATWDATNNRFVTQAVTTAFNKAFGTTVGTISEGNHTHSYQPLDADLTSIAGLAGTTGLLKKTAADTWSLDTSAYLTGITKAQIEAQLVNWAFDNTNPLSTKLKFIEGSTPVFSINYEGTANDPGNKLIIRDESYSKDIITFAQSTGNVAIGTTDTSTYRLKVSGSTVINTTGNSLYGLNVIGTGAATTSDAIFIAGKSGLSNGFTIDWVDATTKMKYQFLDGNVGINKISPSEKLHVAGDVRIDDSSGNAGFKMQYDNTSKSLKFIFVGA